MAGPRAGYIIEMLFKRQRKNAENAAVSIASSRCRDSPAAALSARDREKRTGVLATRKTSPRPGPCIPAGRTATPPAKFWSRCAVRRGLLSRQARRRFHTHPRQRRRRRPRSRRAGCARLEATAGWAGVTDTSYFPVQNTGDCPCVYRECGCQHSSECANSLDDRHWKSRSS